ncbi:MAG TPA: prenyltransferase/squalene oxidase repeat-containing protein [Myxococcaceae bacterium]|nr:prenyltransferase/squalene oxidase repeat-containing protein [Myxococcaceae bacterium]
MRVAVSLVAAAVLASCAAPKPAPPPPPPTTAAVDSALIAAIDAALARAAAWLVDRQQPDGSFRSETYAAFRDGYSLTPMVMKALAFSQADPRTPEAYRRGAAFLATMFGKDGRLQYLNYPVYSLSLSAVALSVSGDEAHVALRRKLVEELRRYQLTEANGWSPEDVSFGGWGYWSEVPRRPRPGEPIDELLSSNLPATVIAAGALAMSGVPPGDPALVRARKFVERCQNLSPPERADPAWDDGGFFFTPANQVQNKAMGGTDRHGATRFRSYGTVTADGIRALLRLGATPADPRVRAAAEWLERRFSARKPAGEYPEIRAVQQVSVRYYWAWTAAHALRALGKDELLTDHGKVRWTEALARALLDEQRPDGTWVNAYTDMREDDPMVATPLAMAGLGISRMVLAVR